MPRYGGHRVPKGWLRGPLKKDGFGGTSTVHRRSESADSPRCVSLRWHLPKNPGRADHGQTACQTASFDGEPSDLQARKFVYAVWATALVPRVADLLPQATQDDKLLHDNYTEDAKALSAKLLASRSARAWPSTKNCLETDGPHRCMKLLA